MEAATEPQVDEALMDCLSNSRDRMVVLKIEEDILRFIANKEETFFDLPPQGSYHRMISHKIADYYGLEHNTSIEVDALLGQKAIRLSKRAETPEAPAPLPTPLREVVAAPENTVDEAPSVFTIARRSKQVQSPEVSETASAGEKTSPTLVIASTLGSLDGSSTKIQTPSSPANSQLSVESESSSLFSHSPSVMTLPLMQSTPTETQSKEDPTPLERQSTPPPIGTPPSGEGSKLQPPPAAKTIEEKLLEMKEAEYAERRARIFGTLDSDSTWEEPPAPLENTDQPNVNNKSLRRHALSQDEVSEYTRSRAMPVYAIPVGPPVYPYAPHQGFIPSPAATPFYPMRFAPPQAVPMMGGGGALPPQSYGVAAAPEQVGYSGTFSPHAVPFTPVPFPYPMAAYPMNAVPPPPAKVPDFSQSSDQFGGPYRPKTIPRPDMWMPPTNVPTTPESGRPRIVTPPSIPSPTYQMPPRSPVSSMNPRSAAELTNSFGAMNVSSASGSTSPVSAQPQGAGVVLKVVSKSPVSRMQHPTQIESLLGPLRSWGATLRFEGPQIFAVFPNSRMAQHAFISAAAMGENAPFTLFPPSTSPTPPPPPPIDTSPKRTSPVASPAQSPSGPKKTVSFSLPSTPERKVETVSSAE